jgi:hypothetical protein
VRDGMRDLGCRDGLRHDAYARTTLRGMVHPNRTMRRVRPAPRLARA